MEMFFNLLKYKEIKNEIFLILENVCFSRDKFVIAKVIKKPSTTGTRL